MTNLFLELKFQHKRNKQTKKAEFSANLPVLSAGVDSDIKIFLNATQKRTKVNWTNLSLLGQERTFKNILKICM